MDALIAALQTTNDALWGFAHAIAALDNGALFNGSEPLPDGFVLVAGSQNETLFDIGMLRRAAEAMRIGVKACRDAGRSGLPEGNAT